MTAFLFAVNDNISNGHNSEFQLHHDGTNERPSISWLLEELINVIKREMDNIGGFLHSPANERRRAITSFLTSTGSCPAYDITQAQIEQIRDTKMNWKTVASFLGYQNKPLAAEGSNTEFLINSRKLLMKSWIII